MSEQIDLTDYADSDSEKGSEWVEKSLGEIFDSIYSGGTPKKGVEEYYGGNIPFVKIEDLNKQQGDGVTTAENYITEQALDETSTRAFEPGTLLMTIYGSLAETAMVRSRVATNQGILGLWGAEEDNVLYVRYAIDNTQSKLASLSRQTTQANLGKGIVKKHKIPSPPLPEQRKIATVLYTVDRAIEKTKKILDQSRQIKKGVVQNLMTKGAQQHTSYEDYRLGPIDLTKPKEWDLRSFGEFSFRIQDGPHITPDYVDEGVPFVSSQNVNPFGEEFDYSQYEKYISEGTYEEINQNCRPEKGDLIISRRATIGPTQLIRHDNQFGFFVGVAVIKTDDTVYNPFLEQLMNWSVMNKLWHLKSPGSTMKTLNLGTIKDQKVPLPSIQEQKEIVEIIGSIDEVIANNQRYKESLQYLKRGLQRDLLSGTVRTTDTNIEVPDEIAQHG